MKKVANFLRRYPWIIKHAYGVWRLFQAKYSVGVVGVVINPENKILVVEHVFHPKVPWGLPGGWVGRKEDPAETVRREFEEELALSIEVGPILIVETTYPNHLDLAYLCRTDQSVGKLSYELLRYEWVDIEQLPMISGFNYRAIMRAVEVLKWH